MSYILGKGRYNPTNNKTQQKYNLFDAEGNSNIRGINREDIMHSVANYNNYYKNEEHDIRVTKAFNSYPEEGAIEHSMGRVDGVGDKYIPTFNSNQENENNIYNNFLSDSIKGNFEAIQRGIKKEVFNLSNGKFKIDHQSENAVKTVMRSYYLQHKIEKNNSILTQIKSINRLIIVWCAENIYSNLLQYQQYKKDITTLPQQLTHPLNMSIKGSYQFDLSKRNDMNI